MISLFSFIFILIILISTCKGKIWVLFITIFFQFISIGYFIKTSTPGFSIVTYGFASCLFLFVYLLFAERKSIRLDRKLALLFLLLGLAFVLSLMSIVDPNLKFNYLRGFNIINASDSNYYFILKIIMGITLLYLFISFIKSCYTKKQLQKVFYYAMLTFVCLSMAVGLIEFVYGISFRLAVVRFFGYHEQSISLTEMFRFNEKGISSLALEPSQFALYLSIGLLTINKYKSKGLLTLLIFIFIILSSSTLGIIYLGLYIFIIALTKIMNKEKIKYIYVIAVVVLIIGLYYVLPNYFAIALQRISYLFNSVQVKAIGSEEYRLSTITGTFAYFKLSPYFGLGYNHIMVFSSVVSLLYEVGLFGFSCYLFVFFHTVKISRSNIFAFTYIVLLIVFTNFNYMDLNLWITFLYLNTFQKVVPIEPKKELEPLETLE